MNWQNSFETQRQFVRTAKKDPFSVFVSAIWHGRQVSLSLPGALDLDPEVRVVGPQNSWMVGVTSVGRKLKLTPFQLRARR